MGSHMKCGLFISRCWGEYLDLQVWTWKNVGENWIKGSFIIYTLRILLLFLGRCRTMIWEYTYITFDRDEKQTLLKNFGLKSWRKWRFERFRHKHTWSCNVRITLEEVGCEGVDFTCLTHDKVQLWIVMNTITHYWVLWTKGNLFTS